MHPGQQWVHLSRWVSESSTDLWPALLSFPWEVPREPAPRMPHRPFPGSRHCWPFPAHWFPDAQKLAHQALRLCRKTQVPPCVGWIFHLCWGGQRAPLRAQPWAASREELRQDWPGLGYVGESGPLRGPQCLRARSDILWLWHGASQNTLEPCFPESVKPTFLGLWGCSESQLSA